MMVVCFLNSIVEMVTLMYEEFVTHSYVRVHSVLGRSHDGSWVSEFKCGDSDSYICRVRVTFICIYTFSLRGGLVIMGCFLNFISRVRERFSRQSSCHIRIYVCIQFLAV